MVQKSHEARLQYWPHRSLVFSFACIAHLLAHLFDYLLPHSRALEKLNHWMSQHMVVLNHSTMVGEMDIREPEIRWKHRKYHIDPITKGILLSSIKRNKHCKNTEKKEHRTMGQNLMQSTHFYHGKELHSYKLESE